MESEKFLLWKQRLEEIKQSDLTVDEWCNQNQISKPTCLYAHLTTLVSLNDATASPRSTALQMNIYPALFYQISTCQYTSVLYH